MINLAHLHPVLVHLPIGILVMGSLFHFFSGKLLTDIIRLKVVKLCLLAGILFSIPVLITGILQFCESELSFNDVFLHLSFALVSILISIFLYFIYSGRTLINHLSFILLLIGISLTGHFGGTLTHGSGYLTSFPPALEHNHHSLKPSLHVVEIKQMKFTPNVVLVNPGDTVLFLNSDFVPHNVVESGKGLWTSPKLHSNESWKLVVDSEADYYCSYHVVMKGQIKFAGHSN